MLGFEEAAEEDALNDDKAKWPEELGFGEEKGEDPNGNPEPVLVVDDPNANGDEDED